MVADKKLALACIFIESKHGPDVWDDEAGLTEVGEWWNEGDRREKALAVIRETARDREVAHLKRRLAELGEP